jgi:uncharacterized membrane protein
LSVVPSNKIHRRLCVIRITLGLARHWLAIFVLIFGLLNILPFVAPVAMRLGWIPIGNTIYTFYSMLCHQMAQRSFFLFGSQAMYNLDKLPLHLTGNTVADMFILREFRGSPNFGWKVAWSDRMITMYGGLWLVSIAYGLLRGHYRLKPLAIKVLLLLTLPIAMDGLTHMVSDVNGLASGFRYTNEWLANLTGHNFADSFYQGDAIGSFNSSARLISGLLFGVGIAAFCLPFFEQESRFVMSILNKKLMRDADSPLSVQTKGRPNGA